MIPILSGNTLCAVLCVNRSYAVRNETKEQKTGKERCSRETKKQRSQTICCANLEYSSLSIVASAGTLDAGLTRFRTTRESSYRPQHVFRGRMGQKQHTIANTTVNTEHHTLQPCTRWNIDASTKRHQPIEADQCLEPSHALGGLGDVLDVKQEGLLERHRPHPLTQGSTNVARRHRNRQLHSTKIGSTRSAYESSTAERTDRAVAVPRHTAYMVSKKQRNGKKKRRKEWQLQQQQQRQ